MKLFPTGAGIVSVCIMLIAVIMAAVFRKTIVAKKSFIAIASCSLIYLSIGVGLFLRPSFFTHGSTYFDSNIKYDAILNHLDNADSAQYLIDRLFAENSTATERTEIKRNDGTVLNMETITWSKDESHYVDIVVYSYANANEAKFDYDVSVESRCALFPRMCLSDFYGFHKTEDYNGWSYMVFPISYDGTKFFLPFVDTSDAYMSMYIYYDNSFIKMTESSDEINEFGLTTIFNNNS